MDAAVWPQEIVVKQMEDILPNACIKQPNGGGVENKANSNNNSSRPQKDQILNCPRCNSTNTKFCYYNNYSLSQPRYFCKSCRRYWTEGGSLRNIPVGGGSRKNNKRSSSLNPSSSSIAPPFKKLHDLSSSSQNPNTLLEGQDLNLAFPAATTTPPPPPPPTTHGFRGMSDFVHLPSNIENNEKSNHHLSALQFLSGVTSRGYNSSFLHMPISDPNAAVYSSSGFSMQEFKPSLNFSLHGLTSNGYPNSVHHQESATGTGSNRPLFPFEDLRQVSNATTNQAEQNREHGDSSAAGYWNGMSGGGSW